MTKESSQRIARRSQAWIIASLLHLLQTKPFAAITITDIIRQADLTRQTFYRHFKSKEDVMQVHIQHLYQQLFAEVEQAPDKSLLQVLTIYFRYWQQHRSLLDLLANSRFHYNPVDCTYPYIEKILACSDFTLPDNPLDRLPLQSFIAGGLATMKNNWLLTHDPTPPEHLAELLTKLLHRYESN